MLSCAPSKVRSYATSVGGVPVDATDYATGDLSQLQEIHSIPLDESSGTLVPGDLFGSSLSEIVVQVGSTVTVFDLNGAQQGSFDLPSAEMSPGFAADIDQDGKDDLVIGGTRGAGAYVASYNGSGQLIHEHTLEERVFGQTTPVAAFDQHLYYTAVSDLHVAPKIVGAMSLPSLEPVWSYHLGPLPTGLSIAMDGQVAVSNRAVERERSDVETPYQSDHSRHHTILLNASGTPVTEIPVDPAAVVGSIVEGAYSGVRNEVAQIDGRPVVVQLLGRISDLYPGQSALRVVAPTGEVIAEHAGPSETNGSMAVYRRNDELRIAVYWSKAGVFELYSQNLDLLTQKIFGRSPARGELLQVGNFDGDDEVEHLVADRGRIAIISETGAVEYETEVPTRVRDARIVPATGNAPRLVVLSDALRFYSPPAPTNVHDSASTDAATATGTLRVMTKPSGAQLRIDGTLVDDVAVPRLFELAAGDHTVEAFVRGYQPHSVDVTIAPGRVSMVDVRLARILPAPTTNRMDRTSIADRTHLGVVRDREPVRELREPPELASSYAALSVAGTGSIAEGFVILGIGEFAGDDDPDILLFHRDERQYLVLSDDLEPILHGRFPVKAGNSLAIYGDLDGDGRAEIGARDSTDATALFAVSTDGRVVLDKSFCYGFDTNVSLSTRTETQLLATINTGYLLSPRGAYGVRIGDWKTEFFYPTAGMVSGVIERDGLYYADLYTANNGAEVTRPDGYVETDANIHIHVIDTKGARQPLAQPLGGQRPHGSIRPFSFASVSDTKPAPHYILSKDHYYPGASGILRGGDVWQQVFTAGTDLGVVASHVLTGSAHYLSVVWSGKNLHQIIDNQYEVIYQHEYGEHRLYITSVNLDGGAWEIVERRDDKIVVLDLDRSVVAELELPSEPIRSVRFGDVTGDGRFEAIILGSSEIAVYSY